MDSEGQDDPDMINMDASSNKDDNDTVMMIQGDALDTTELTHLDDDTASNLTFAHMN